MWLEKPFVSFSPWTNGGFKIPRSGNMHCKSSWQYIEKAKNLQKDQGHNQDQGQGFLISFGIPHKCITTSIVSRWSVIVLKNTDVVKTVLESHWTRSAMTACCIPKILSVKESNKAAEWASSKTFVNHHNKPTVDEIWKFSRTVLES